MDIVIEALKMYWKNSKTNLPKLFKYARDFRQENILKSIMEVIVSGE